MIILAHRGWWLEADEKNSMAAFERAFRAGYGVELDVRDLAGQLVIAHDPAVAGAIPFDDVLDLYASYGAPGRMAVNIKADGLAQMIAAAALRLDLAERVFVFDASVPDLKSYLPTGLRVFTRYSEVEPIPAFYDVCQGVWVDSFTVAPASIERAISYLDQGKQVALVSPELHKRPHEKVWSDWSAAIEAFGGTSAAMGRLMICTDFPEDAEQHFTTQAEFV